MGNLRILLAEDEKNVANFLILELQFENYIVDHAEDGEEALRLFEKNHYDILLLDWMMPKLDGVTLCKRIRKKSSVPIIILTARDYIGDKIAGLDSGADDYITKPFEIEELLARVRAVLRRQLPNQPEDNSLLEIDTLKIDVKKHHVFRGEKKIDLTQKEFNLLYLLMSKKDEVLSREDILSEVWGYDFVGQTNVVDVYILYLRNKLELEGEKKLIHTVRSVGYVLRERS